jgi:tetratricopeptide (TPR) repeat protein
MRYIKIVLALIIWGLLFFYGGSSWLDNKREESCMSEIEKESPNIDIVNKHCLQTADIYMKNRAYGSAAWFYLLAGEYRKNIDEVEGKITNGFYMNIGHSYLLEGNYTKAKEIYTNYPWDADANFYYADEDMQHDFVILHKLYKDKKENLEKGLAIWNEIYAPIAKIVEASNAYDMAEEDGDSSKQLKYLKEYLEYAKPYREKSSINYIEKQVLLADFYSLNSLEMESIATYKDLLSYYETNSSYIYNHIDTLLNIATKYRYIPEYNSSLEYYQEALSLTLDLNESEKKPLEVNCIYANIAELYKEMNLSKEAIANYKNALKYVEKHDASDYKSLSSSYQDMANIYYIEEDYNLSIANYLKSIALKKEEIKESEDDYREYSFIGLQELYHSLANIYKVLKMPKKAKAVNQEYLSFLEYEYENHYKVIANAYSSLIEDESNITLALSYADKAIKFIEKSIETELGSEQEINNHILYGYMNNLELYLYAIDNNETRAAKKYLQYVDHFEAFQEKVFGGEDNNSRLLAKSYNFISQSYRSASDLNRSYEYAYRAVRLMERVEDGADMSDDCSNYDSYVYTLWDIGYMLHDDVEPLIDNYFKFKNSHYEKGSFCYLSSFETVGKFFLEHQSVDRAVIEYKNLLNEAVVPDKDSQDAYRIELNIAKLRDIYTNNLIDKQKAMEYMKQLILWQEENYNSGFILARSHVCLANMYAEDNQTKMFEQELYLAIKVLKEYLSNNRDNIDALETLEEIYQMLIDYYKKEHKREKSLKLREEFLSYVKKEFSGNDKVLALYDNNLSKNQP